MHKSVVSKNYGKELPIETRTLCPECKKPLKGLIYEKEGKIFIKRECSEHGLFDEVYWEDSKYYDFARKFAAEAKGIKNPNVGFLIDNKGFNCPFDCGLCSNHHSHTALSNVVVTNRCDLSCWYCFFYAKEGEPIYEPSLKQLKNMFKNLRNEKPIANNAIQITGGEPTLRKDLIEIIKAAKKEGFDHIQLNTHAINLAFNKNLVLKLKKAGVNTLYMSFDGVTPKTNPKNHWEAALTIENCRKADLGIVLVPTVINNFNDHELGKIINFALNNIDVIRGVNFQPVSLVGRMPKKEIEKQRITIPGTIKKIEEQTNGIISLKDFYPVPCVMPFSNFVEAITGQEQYELSIHFACGAATYLFLDGKKVIPITRFIDVEGLFEYLKEKTEEIKKSRLGLLKKLKAAKMLLDLHKFIDKEKQPKNINFAKLLFDALIKHDYSALGELHKKTLFIGMMHFMDPYNYDQMRVERCDIHYAMPDGRIVPFCSFNVLPELYRDKIQKQFSISFEEWKKKNKGEEAIIKYKRNTEELTAKKEYKKAYTKLYDYFNGKEINLI